MISNIHSTDAKGASVYLSYGSGGARDPECLLHVPFRLCTNAPHEVIE